MSKRKMAPELERALVTWPIQKAHRELRALLAVVRLVIHARDNIAQVARVLRGHGCSTGDDLNGEARALENIVDGLDRRLRSLSRPAQDKKGRK